MRPVVLACLAVGVLLAAGCGGGGDKSGSSVTTPTIPTSTEPPTPTITSAADVAACNVMARNLNVVAEMITNNKNLITSAPHPEQLAGALVAARKVLIYAAKVMQLGDTPQGLKPARDNFVSGIKDLAADYKQAQPFVAKKDLATAATYMQDGPAFQKIEAATKLIQRTCNA